MSNGYTEFRAYVDEDVTVTVTVEGSGSLTGTYAGRLWAPGGGEVADAVAVAITSADARELTATLTGLDLAATTYYGPYRLEIRRTDLPARTVVAWGPLELTDPAGAPPG